MKKILAIILLFGLICTVFTGCTQNDEEAIKQVITAFSQASYTWDYQTMKACVAPEVPMYDPYESAKNSYMGSVNDGFLVEADVEKFLELERDFNRQLGEHFQYLDWNITISADTATAILTVSGSGVNFDAIMTEDGKFQYRDTLFTDLCGMDEATAKESLSPEEFSAVHLKVQEAEYRLWLENLSVTEEKMEVQLRKIDSQWRIVNILPVEQESPSL